MRSYLKNNYSKKGAEGVPQVVEHLPSKHKALKFIPQYHHPPINK
jgi:hypothetical protein